MGPEEERALSLDPRTGAQAVLRVIRARREQNRREQLRLELMLRHEQRLWSDGYSLVAGIDEAGMSPLAGPVVAAAIILPKDYRLAGVDDSKKLSASKREYLAIELKKHALAWAIGSALPSEIDEINIYHAGLLAMRRAAEGLDPQPDALLIDARPLKAVPLRQESIVKGDQESFSIAAASILAKTNRDALMCALDERFPEYGFAKHKGYPVAAHVNALRRFGACPEHRRSFAPVRAVLAR